MEQNRSITDQVLVQSGAPDFEDASTAERAAIRHTPSGMVCVLPSNGSFDMGVFPASAQNSGAYCNAAGERHASSLVATRYSSETTLDQVFAGAVSTTVGAEAQAWPGRPSAADRAPPEGLPHYRILRFQKVVNGQMTFVRVAASEARGWYLQQVVMAPIEEAETTEEEAGVAWRAALRAFSQPPS